MTTHTAALLATLTKPTRRVAVPATTPDPLRCTRTCPGGRRCCLCVRAGLRHRLCICEWEGCVCHSAGRYGGRVRG